MIVDNEQHTNKNFSVRGYSSSVFRIETRRSSYSEKSNITAVNTTKKYRISLMIWKRHKFVVEVVRRSIEIPGREITRYLPGLRQG